MGIIMYLLYVGTTRMTISVYNRILFVFHATSFILFNTWFWVCQVFCVSFYFQVADYYIVRHFFRLNNSHISGFVPVDYHPWKAGCGQVPSLIQDGCSIFYTVPQCAGKVLSILFSALLSGSYSLLHLLNLLVLDA